MAISGGTASRLNRTTSLAVHAVVLVLSMSAKIIQPVFQLVLPLQLDPPLAVEQTPTPTPRFSASVRARLRSATKSLVMPMRRFDRTKFIRLGTLKASKIPAIVSVTTNSVSEKPIFFLLQTNGVFRPTIGTPVGTIWQTQGIKGKKKNAVSAGALFCVMAMFPAMRIAGLKLQVLHCIVVSLVRCFFLAIANLRQVVMAFRNISCVSNAGKM